MKKRYILLVLDIISCVFFLSMLWISYTKDLGTMNLMVSLFVMVD